MPRIRETCLRYFFAKVLASDIPQAIADGHRCSFCNRPSPICAFVQKLTAFNVCVAEEESRELLSVPSVVKVPSPVSQHRKQLL